MLDWAHTVHILYLKTSNSGSSGTSRWSQRLHVLTYCNVVIFKKPSGFEMHAKEMQASKHRYAVQLPVEKIRGRDKMKLYACHETVLCIKLESDGVEELHTIIRI